MTVPAPDLRIVSDTLWTAARERLTSIKSRLMASSDGRIGRRVRDVESVHLLAGFARCGTCGASFYPLSRSHWPPARVLLPAVPHTTNEGTRGL